MSLALAGAVPPVRRLLVQTLLSIISVFILYILPVFCPSHLSLQSSWKPGISNLKSCTSVLPSLSPKFFQLWARISYIWSFFGNVAVTHTVMSIQHFFCGIMYWCLCCKMQTNRLFVCPSIKKRSLGNGLLLLSCVPSCKILKNFYLLNDLRI